MLEVTVIPVDE